MKTHHPSGKNYKPMDRFETIIKTDGISLDSQSRVIFDAKSGTFLVFSNSQSSVCCTTFHNRSSVWYQSKQRIDTALGIGEPFPKLYYDIRNNLIVFACPDQLFIQAHDLQKLSNSLTFKPFKLGPPLGPRKIRRLKFHPKNAKCIGVLYESNLFEIYDLDTDLDSPFLYKNLTFAGDHVVAIAKCPLHTDA